MSAIRLSDRDNDVALVASSPKVIDQHVVPPVVLDLAERMFCSIEIIDLFVSLAYIRDR